MKKNLISLFLFFAFYFSSFYAGADVYPFYIKVEQQNQNSIAVKAYNRGNMAITIKIYPVYDPSFRVSSDKRATDMTFVVERLTTKTLMNVATERTAKSIMDFKFNYAWTFGDYKKLYYTDYIYTTPYTKTYDTVIEKLYKEETPDKKERYKYAYNFIGNGGDVIAARSGLVFDLRAYESETPNKSDEDIKAYIRVVHQDGTFSEYFNLPYDSIYVKLNQSIREGQFIAKADSFSFAVMMPTINGTPNPIQYSMRVNTGGRIITNYIDDKLNLEKYNPKKYEITPWYKPKIKKSNTYLYILFAIIIFVLPLSIYFYLRYKKQKNLIDKNKQEHSSQNTQSIHDTQPPVELTEFEFKKMQLEYLDLNIKLNGILELDPSKKES